MKLKQAITFFCLLVLTIQLLPVQQLGRQLFNSQFTEELPHDADDAMKDVKGKLPFKTDFLIAGDSAAFSFIQTAGSQYIHFAISLPSFHTKDVHTPPPNAA